MPEPPPLGSFTLPKWRVFESWCLAHAVDPVNCPVGPVLDQQGNSIAARRELDEIPLGRHRMVSAFMRGVRRLRPVRPIGVPSWDLSIVLEGLMAAPFEPLESAPEQILTLKFMFLLALASLKRVGDLQVLSVSEMCMDFAPGLVKVTLRPWPGYVPQGFIRIVSLSSGHTSLFSASLCFRWGWEASHALSCPSFEDICGPLQTWENLPICLCALVLAAVDLPHRNTEFLTGWGTLFRWLMRCVAFLHLSAFGRTLLGAWPPLELFSEESS